MFDHTKIDKTVNIACETPQFCPNRIDRVLCAHFPEYSRTFFQKLMDEGFIHINGSPNTKSSYLVKEADTITVNFPRIKPLDLNPKKVDFGVVDNHNDFIIINKPAGLLVHPVKKESKDEISLVNGLLYHFDELNQFENKERPGIVHRLDKGTSGLMVVAKNIPAQIKLSQMFKNREVKKTYLAVVKGHPSKKDKIDFDIGRHRTKRHLMSHVTYDGRKALTYYEVLVYYKDCSLVAVQIVTGRTHQIRVHFAAIGHGLLGDEVYGYNSKLIQRPALHSWKLAFEYKDQKYSYWRPVPQDFQKLLKTLNQKNS